MAPRSPAALPPAAAQGLPDCPGAHLLATVDLGEAGNGALEPRAEEAAAWERHALVERREDGQALLRATLRVVVGSVRISAELEVHRTRFVPG